LKLFNTSNKKAVGDAAEGQALAYLQDQGLTHITSNFQCKLGEIDLIMKTADTLVFVEVKFRSSSRYGQASEMVTASKQKKLINTAAYYLQKTPKFRNFPCRFDVVALKPDSTQEHQINWIPNAFSALDN
jgi:putative endonuclease